MNTIRHLLVAIIAISFLSYSGGPVQASTLENIEPLSDAGPDQIVATLAVVTLDGSASSDPDGNLPLTYLWTQTGGSTVELSDPTVVNPSFTASADPSVLTFSLVVTDSLALADPTPDEVTITVENQAPVADAGPDQTALISSLVTLDGSMSSDPDGDVPLVYLWEQISGPTVSLSDATAASPTFMAPSTEAALTFSLTVTDSLGLAALTPDTVTVTVDYSRTFLPMILAPFSPAGFNKSSPANGTTNLSATPTLSWGSTSPVTSYEYCYDTSNDNACSNWLSNGTSISVLLPPLQESTTYYWQVRARNASAPLTYANDSPAAFWSFTTAALPPAAFNKISPANGAFNQSLTPTLSWGSTSPLTLYEYCYDATDDLNCSNWTFNGTATSVTLPTLLPNTVYFWHVRAWSASLTPTYSNGSPTAFWAFITGAPPASFSKLSPANGVVNQSLTMTLSWQPTSPLSQYDYCYDTSNDNTCSNWTYNGTSTSVALPLLLPNTTYYWQVRAWSTYPVATYADGSATAFWAFTTVVQSWTKLFTETFENPFPGLWQLESYWYYDGWWDVTEFITWGKQSCHVDTGQFAGWMVGGGTEWGNPWNCSSGYPTNHELWMVYGPINLSQVYDGNMTLRIWSDTEYENDYMGWGVSLNNNNFFGRYYTGNSGGWITDTINLKDVYNLGNVIGQPNVWIGIWFDSDLTNPVFEEGVAVDNLNVYTCSFATGCSGSLTPALQADVPLSPGFRVIEAKGNRH